MKSGHCLLGGGGEWTYWGWKDWLCGRLKVWSVGFARMGDGLLYLCRGSRLTDDVVWVGHLCKECLKSFGCTGSFKKGFLKLWIPWQV